MTDAATSEDAQTTAGLVLSRSAVDGAEVTHFKITGISNGALYENDGTTPVGDGAFIPVAVGNAGLKFTPAANFSGSGGFTIQASTSNSDAGLGGSTVNATITVAGVNDAPVLGGGTLAAVAENTASPAGQAVATVFAGQFGDVDAGSSLGGIAVVGNAADAGTEGVWQYSSDGGANWFAVGAVADGATALAVGSASLVRFLPVADYNGSPPALVVRGLDDTYAGGFSTTAAGETRVTVDTAVNGGSTAIAAATATLSTTITSVNTPPVITSDGGGATAAVSVPENTTAVTTVSAADADLPAQALTYSLAGGADAARFSINTSTGALAFTGAPDFEAPADANGDNVYLVTVQVSDGSGGTDTQDLSVSVSDVAELPVNQPPVITSGGGGPAAELEIPENSAGVGVVKAIDPEGATIAYAVAGGADAGLFTLDPSAGTLSFVAAPDFERPTDANGDGVYDVEVAASDGSLSDRQSLGVRVLDVSEAPANRMPLRVDTNEDVPLVLGAAAGSAISIGDPDANGSVRATLSVSRGTLTLAGRAGLAFEAGDGAGDSTMRLVGSVAAVNAALGGLVFTPAANANGLVVLTLVSADPDRPELGDRGSTEIMVRPVNDAPELAAITGRQVRAGATLRFAAQATDVDGPKLSYSLAGAPAGAVIDPVTGTFSWTPAATFEPGSYTFDVVVRDGGDPLGTDRTTTTVTVTAATPSNAAPIPAAGPGSNPGRVPGGASNGTPPASSGRQASGSAGTSGQALQARDDLARVTTGEPTAIAVLANDTVADPTRIVVEVGPAGHGSVRVLPDGSVLYSAALGFEGTDSFSYTILGESGHRSSAVVHVVVSLPAEVGPAWFGGPNFSGPLLGKGGPARHETLEQTAQRRLHVGFLGLARALLDTLQTLDVPIRLFAVAGAWFGFLGFALLVFRRRRAFLVDGVARHAALDVLDRPEGQRLYQLRFDEGPVWSTGRRRKVRGRAWFGVQTPAGRGFIQGDQVLSLDRAVDSPQAVLGAPR